jgi:exonuclease III
MNTATNRIIVSSINVLYESYYVKYRAHEQEALTFQSRSDSAEKAFKKLLAMDTDFICLQEWSRNSFRLIDLEDFPELSISPFILSEKEKFRESPAPAILYSTTKYEMLNSSTVYLESSKGICKGEFKSRANNKTLTVLSIHAPFSSNITEYNNFYTEIEKIVKPIISNSKDVVICGDFNNSSKFIEDENTPIYKELSKVDFGELGTCRTSGNVHKQFDHIFYFGNLKLQDTFIEPQSMEDLVPHNGSINSVSHFSDHAIITAIFDRQ